MDTVAKPSPQVMVPEGWESAVFGTPGVAHADDPADQKATVEVGNGS